MPVQLFPKAVDESRMLEAWHALTQEQLQDLKDHMRGRNRDLNVVHVDIMLEPNGRSKGCALVEYTRWAGVRTGIQA